MQHHILLQLQSHCTGVVVNVEETPHEGNNRNTLRRLLGQGTEKMKELLSAVEEELLALQKQLANRTEEHRAAVQEHQNEARLYRATIADLRDEISRLSVLAEGRDKAMTQLIAQRDEAMTRLEQVHKMTTDLERLTNPTLW